MDLFASDVLVIDDDVDVRRVLSRTLGSAGYMVTAAHNGVVAMGMLERHPFAAIVSDVRMPEMNGLEFYEQLANEYPSMARRLMFVTGYLADDDVSSFIGRTGQPVLAKPFDLAELVRTVRRLMQAAKGSEQDP
jgi:two-component system NtrC family sensor kinase